VKSRPAELSSITPVHSLGFVEIASGTLALGSLRDDPAKLVLVHGITPGRYEVLSDFCDDDDDVAEEGRLRRSAYIELVPGGHFAAAVLVLGRVPTIDHVMDLFDAQHRNGREVCSFDTTLGRGRYPATVDLDEEERPLRLNIAFAGEELLEAERLAQDPS
jgi:hypothetical protein